VGSRVDRVPQPQASAPNVKPEDFLLPNEAGRFRTFFNCSFCALGLTFLYVFFPLMMVSFFVSLGQWFGVALGISFVGLTVVLYRVAVRETRELRRLARE
jgi:hypothetical protein